MLYVEDDPRIAEMVVDVLRESYTVDHVADGEAGLQAALHNHYDVMIVDRRLPSMDGAALTAAIRRARITTPILMLTALSAVHDRVEGLDVGANDYLVKPFDLEELLARLRALRRGFQADGQRNDIGDWLFVADSLALYGPIGQRVALTATEGALLSLLCSSPERIFGRAEIMRTAFADASGPGTVDTYVHHLRRKSDPDIIETVRGRGYRLGRPA